MEEDKKEKMEETKIKETPEEKTESKKEQKNKKSKRRMILVLLFVLIFGIISYIQLRGSYLEYLELGEEYTSVFFTNLFYRYTIMAINFIILYIIIYFTNKGIKKGLKPFFEKENKTFKQIISISNICNSKYCSINSTNATNNVSNK